ncbi:hypothetical protein ACTJLB_28185, partial [Paraburkholderia sp. 22098]|uniref:hypothetical protein n=1 Tax=Paraburkholderia sp. 22098 TaxID=3453874 RepID=UPI003F82A2F9
PKPLTPDRDHRRYNPLTAQHHHPDRSRSPKRLITITEIRTLRDASISFLPSLEVKGWPEKTPDGRAKPLKLFGV